MTANSLARAWDPPVERFRLSPAEGWITLGMVALLVESFVWSLQDAGWVPSAQGSTAHLFFLALAAILIEFLGAKAGWGRWRTHLLAGVIGGLLLPYVAAITVASVGRTPVDWLDVKGVYQSAGLIAYRVWADLARDGKPFTTEYGHYHMVFGAMVWAAAMLATSAVFQRRRPFDAVVVVGILLLTNMIVQAAPPLGYLVVFSVAALILLVRAHSFEEQMIWIRRRIGDPSAVSGLYLRGGTSFIGIAVVGALVLTLTASSAPLQGMWNDLPTRLQGVADWLQKFAPTGGNVRGLGAVGFGATASTNGFWSPASGVAFTAVLPANDALVFKWRAGVYSTYDGQNRWTWGDTDTALVPAKTDVLAATRDDPETLAGLQPITFTIQPGAFDFPTILSPATVDKVDRDTTVHVAGEGFSTVEAVSNGGSYTVTALIPNPKSADAITQNRLRVSPRSYPADVTSTYLAVPDRTLGPASLQVFEDVKARASSSAPQGNPFDFAKQLESYLRSDRFTYQADVRDDVRNNCSAVSSVECFAIIRKGYCEYYAGFMTMLLRHDGIPARIAYGFLPGTPAADGTEIVKASNAHWWVEAYFTGYGWVEFDPTGGNGAVPQFIPQGAAESAKPGVDGTPRPRGGRGEQLGGDSSLPPFNVGRGNIQSGPKAGSGIGPFIVIGVLLLVAVAALMFAARRRGPRKAMDPDSAWGGLGRLANRFGYGPRPYQTVYEYAGSLGDAVPSMRAELQTVARAKVEVAYGRQELTTDRLKAVGDAYRRLRFAIVRRGLVRWPGRRRR